MTTIPNKYNSQKEVDKVLHEGYKCRCGGELKYHQIDGSWWLLCIKHPAHRGLVGKERFVGGKF